MDTRIDDRINKLEKGSGISFKAFGHDGEFKLALVKKKSFSRISYEYVYINDTSHVIDSLYSGGTTKFGVSDWPRELQTLEEAEILEVVTFDVDEMNRMADESELKEQKRKEEFDAKQTIIAENINTKLATIFPFWQDDSGRQLIIKRRKATYESAGRSRAISCHIEVQLGSKDKGYEIFWMSHFIASNGRLLVKKFAEEIKWRNIDVEDPRSLLAMMIEKKEEVQKSIRDLSI